MDFFSTGPYFFVPRFRQGRSATVSGGPAYGFENFFEVCRRCGINLDCSSVVRQLNFYAGQTLAANDVDNFLDDIHGGVGDANPDGDDSSIQSSGLLHARGLYAGDALDFGFE